MTAPRLFGIVASRAPVVAVLRRGPSAWSQVGRWDLDTMSYEPGPWLHGTIYPQRCDLSADGRWLSYFVLQPSARWDVGTTYVAVSELPALQAVAAWATCGTWTRGAHFTDGPGQLGAPSHGDVSAIGFGLAWTPPATFAVERRRGWTETSDTPPRGEHDPWDEKRARLVRMERQRPGGSDRLVVGGRYAAHRSMAPEPPSYSLVGGGRVLDLPGLSWADWAADGRLLSATLDGRLQVRDGLEIAWEYDLSGLAPP